MKGQAYINGKDIWLTWGAILVKGAYEKLLKPAPMKEYITNSSRLEHGIRIVTTSDSIKTDERDVSIQFFIKGNSGLDYLQKQQSFISELEKGNVELRVTRLKTTYNLVYTECSSYGDYGIKMGKFTVKFIEPNTKNRKSVND